MSVVQTNVQLPSHSRVSFSFLPKGGQNEIVWVIGGGRGKYVSVCKACGELGGQGACSPVKF